MNKWKPYVQKQRCEDTSPEFSIYMVYNAYGNKSTYIDIHCNCLTVCICTVCVLISTQKSTVPHLPLFMFADFCAIYTHLPLAHCSDILAKHERWSRILRGLSLSNVAQPSLQMLRAWQCTLGLVVHQHSFHAEVKQTIR